MAKKPNTVGGGAKTNFNGLEFEGRTDLLKALNDHPDFTVVGNQVFRNGEIVAHYYEKHNLYTGYLKPAGVDYSKILSKKFIA